MKNIQTRVQEDIQWDRLTLDEKNTIRRELKALSVPEKSVLATGRSLIAIRSITETTGDWARALKKLPFVDRTAYRRIKSYEKAKQMWPDELIDAAIARELDIVGTSPEKPMGFYEDIDAFTGRPTPQRVDAYLTAASLQVRLRDTRVEKNGDSYELLKDCFREVYRSMVALPVAERKKFKEDLVGVILPLFGSTEPETFKARNIPEDFYPTVRGAFERSPESRSRMSQAATARWNRRKAMVASA